VSEVQGDSLGHDVEGGGSETDGDTGEKDNQEELQAVTSNDVIILNSERIDDETNVEGHDEIAQTSCKQEENTQEESAGLFLSVAHDVFQGGLLLLGRTRRLLRFLGAVLVFFWLSCTGGLGSFRVGLIFVF